MSDVEQELVRRRDRGEAMVLATVVKIGGRPPSRPGEKILVGPRGEALAGTLGCSEFDSAARADGPLVLTGTEPALRTYTHDLGTIEVYLEPYLPRPLLVVLGTTPVAAAILAWAGELGFATTSTAPNDDGPAGREIYAVHTDHDAPGIVDELEAVLRQRPRFLGVMGSRRHTGHHLDELRARGIDEAAITAIQSPVGLDIGARSAAEIGLSILAGVVAARHGAGGGWKAVDSTASPPS